MKKITLKIVVVLIMMLSNLTSNAQVDAISHTVGGAWWVGWDNTAPSNLLNLTIEHRGTQNINFLLGGIPSGQLDQTGWANTSFGLGTFNSIVLGSAVNNSLFGDNVGFNLSSGTDNSFFGAQSGFSNTWGFQNSFYGSQSGISNTSGLYNSFFGYNSGASNQTGQQNTYVGWLSGQSSTVSTENTFLGCQSGPSTTGSWNTFLGEESAFNNKTGQYNMFAGHASGFNSLSDGNSFAGDRSGFGNTTGVNNAAFGRLAGATNTTGDYNLYLGTAADASANNLTEATAIGFGAIVTKSYRMILGQDTVRVGIGLSGDPTGPLGKLHVENDAGIFDGVNIAGKFHHGGASPFGADACIFAVNDATSTGFNCGGQFFCRHANANIAVSGIADKTADTNVGVYGQASDAKTYNYGVIGKANIVSGYSPTNFGGDFSSQGQNYGINYGVRALVGQGKSNFGVYSMVMSSPTAITHPSPCNIAVYGNCLSNSSIIPPFVGNLFAGYFDGDVFINGPACGTGFAMTSDAMFKTHVDSLTNAMDLLKKLKSKTYYMDTTNIYGMNFSSKPQIGFIAQDVMTVLPQLVEQEHKPAMVDTLGNIITPAVDYKALNYVGFIPLLTRGLIEESRTIDSLKAKNKKQDSINASLQNQINALSDMINNCCNSVHSHGANYNGGSAPTNDIANTDVKLSDVHNIVLNDNIPNPWSETTTIGYALPDNTTSAQMLFYNASGKLIKSVGLTNKGIGQVNVYAEDLSSGIYTYTLVVDGKIFGTKKMVKQ